MFDRFTERARKSMSLARQEALRFHHDYIGTEHLLLGLVEEGSGVAAQVLKSLGVAPHEIRVEVEKIVQHGTNMVSMGQIPFTPRAKRVLELSLEEAQTLGHSYIGTEHLLLGIIRERDGIAAQVLVGLGTKIEQVRAEVLKLLGADPEADGPHAKSGGTRGPGAAEPTLALLRIAREQAALRGHRFIGTEHLLLGLVLHGGPAAELLSTAGATADTVRGAVGKLRADGLAAAAGAFSRCANDAMSLAAEESQRLGGGLIGPEHVLFGLLAVPEGLAVTALTSVGVQIDDLRARVAKLLGGE